MNPSPVDATPVSQRAQLPMMIRSSLVRVVLMGPPGSGKGTQAGTVANLVGVAYVGSGDLFREAARNGTELGRRAKPYMDRGELVPDDLTVAMVIARLSEPDCEQGFVLDGFPRSVSQAQALDDTLASLGRPLDRVINIQVPEQTLLRRLSGRWLCSNCHASYHTVFSPPTTPGVCDRCGGELYQRVDDREDTARHRLEVYFGETVPVLDYYRAHQILVEVNGDQPIADVTRSLREALPRNNGTM
jgi:adenylate kinase